MKTANRKTFPLDARVVVLLDTKKRHGVVRGEVSPHRYRVLRDGDEWPVIVDAEHLEAVSEPVAPDEERGARAMGGLLAWLLIRGAG